jgi:hypothetical protein
MAEMALVKSIEFRDDGSPEAVTLRLSADEAALVALLTGRQNSVQAEELLPHGGAVASSALYDATAQYVFGPFWDNGVSDYLDERERLHT